MKSASRLARLRQNRRLATRATRDSSNPGRRWDACAQALWKTEGCMRAGAMEDGGMHAGRRYGRRRDACARVRFAACMRAKLRKTEGGDRRLGPAGAWARAGPIARSSCHIPARATSLHVSHLSACHVAASITSLHVTRPRACHVPSRVTSLRACLQMPMSSICTSRLAASAASTPSASGPARPARRK